MITILIVAIVAAVAIPMMRGRVDTARWSEGKSIMGTIAVAIRAYAAVKGEKGTYGTNLPNITDLGFTASEFNGTYFDANNFSWFVSFANSNDPPLTFTITADNVDTGIFTPSLVTLDESGNWEETP
jgi:type II secretory pathway pseudopilin PulG